MDTAPVKERFGSTINRAVFWSASFFITFGSGFLLIMAMQEYQLATASSPTNLASTISSTETIKETDVALQPSVSFVTSLPSVIPDPLDVIIKASHVVNPKLRIKGLSGVFSSTIAPRSHQADEYKFTVPTKDLPPGSYQLNIAAFSLTGEQIITHGPTFTIKDETDPSTLDTKKSSNDVITDDKFTVALQIDQTKITAGDLPMVVTTSRRVDSVAVYAQKENTSGSPRFVGSAREVRNNEWLLAVDVSSFENGVYQISAVATRQDVKSRSRTVKIVVEKTITNTLSTTQTANIDQAAETANTTQVDETTATRTSEQTEAPLSAPDPVLRINQIVSPGVVRQTSPPSEANTPAETIPTRTSNDITSSSVSLVSSTDIVVRRVLQENQSLINQRIQQFIAANDEAALADEILQARLKTAIAEELLRDRRLRNISPDAQALIINEVNTLVANAIRLELGLRQLADAGEELGATLDQFADSLEIPDSAVTDVRSPREFGLVRDDLYSVTSVEPVVVTDESSSSSIVYTEITGRAIPNSRVSIYIYSSPVMVTVTASADGTFTYLYENELDDGDHEVYVALTNTNGAVVAKSNGFRFIKEAQAFTFVDDVTGDALIPIASNSTDSSSYMAVLALSIVALGALLLVLGTGLRRKTPIVHERH